MNRNPATASALSRRGFLKSSTLALGTTGLAANTSAQAASWFPTGRNLDLKPDLLSILIGVSDIWRSLDPKLN